MSIFEMITAAQSGTAISLISQHAGLHPAKTVDLIQRFLPTLMESLAQHSANHGGVSGLLSTLNQNNYNQYYTNPHIYSNSYVRQSAIEIMSQVIGPEDIQNQIIGSLSTSTGIAVEIIRFVIPYTTLLALSALYIEAHKKITPADQALMPHQNHSLMLELSQMPLTHNAHALTPPAQIPDNILYNEPLPKVIVQAQEDYEKRKKKQKFHPKHLLRFMGDEKSEPQLRPKSKRDFDIPEQNLLAPQITYQNPQYTSNHHYHHSLPSEYSHQQQPNILNQDPFYNDIFFNETPNHRPAPRRRYISLREKLATELPWYGR
ncbi:MAG: DUF937 domain-containing protein [Pseudomonadota bacterium]